MLEISNFIWTTNNSFSNDTLLWNLISWELKSGHFILEALGVTALLSSSYASTNVLNALMSEETSSDLFFVNFLYGLFSDNVVTVDLLYNSFLLDYFRLVTTLDLEKRFIFVTDSKSFLLLFFNQNKELALILMELMNFDYKTVVNVSESFIYSMYSDNASWGINKTVFLLTVIFSYLLFSLLFSPSFKSAMSDTYSTNWTRWLYYFFSVSLENRVQFDLFINFVFFFLFYWVFNLMMYSDEDVEFIESISLFLTFYFFFIISILLFKYSTHYFSFLEASFTEGKSASFISKQFVRDVSNTFALFLRFSLLILRLNIYDGLDDFLESYYIPLCDFDCDNYYDECLVLFDSSLFFIKDNSIDSGITTEIESDSLLDIFSIYYITVGKYSFFWILILEEIFRVSLALYISYLIIFEVHSVNVSYLEDSYFYSKRI